MNSMAPRYTFNMASNRFDMIVRDAYQSDKVSRHTRDQLIAEVRDGQWDHLLLRRLGGLENLPAALSEKAALNVIDFNFEPIVLRNMPDAPLETYFTGFHQTMRIDSLTGMGDGGPLWIDSVHHNCVFSVMYDFLAYLARDRGYRKPILLHRGLAPEPRLACIDRLMRNLHGVPMTFIPLQGNWFSSLAKAVTPDSAVFYFTDMPQEMTTRSAPAHRGKSVLRLGAPQGISIDIETLSGSSTFARRLGVAAHVVLEYPAADHIRVRPFEEDNQVSHCPLTDWVYWPALQVT